MAETISHPTPEQYQELVTDALSVLRTRSLTTQWVIQRESRLPDGRSIIIPEIVADRMPSHPTQGSYQYTEQQRVWNKNMLLTVGLRGKEGPVAPAGVSTLKLATEYQWGGSLVREQLSLGLSNNDEPFSLDVHRVKYLCIAEPDEMDKLLFMNGKALYRHGGATVPEMHELVVLGLMKFPPIGVMTTSEIPKYVQSFGYYDNENPEVQLESLAAYPNAKLVDVMSKAQEMLMLLKISQRVADTKQIPYSGR